jgi:hypothetical protein
LFLSVAPGGVLVVEGPGAEAAVEDADEAVRNGSEGLVVEVALGSSVVVVRSNSVTASSCQRRQVLRTSLEEAPQLRLALRHA